MHRDHPQAGVEEPLDQRPTRSLERHQLDCELDQPRAQRLDPALIMPVAASLEVPWRVLIDGALRVRLPVAAQGTATDRREALVSYWPSARTSDAGALPTAAGIPEDDQ